jgi:hypothetical protein
MTAGCPLLPKQGESYTSVLDPEQLVLEGLRADAALLPAYDLPAVNAPKS